MRKLYLAYILFVCLFCCNLYAQEKSLNKVVKITKIAEQVIEPDDNHQFLNNASFIQYDEINKLIYIVNKGDSNILVLNEDFDLVRKIGRFGQGPGEFQKISAISLTHEGNIVVTDRGRVQVLSNTGEYIGGFRVQLRSSVFPICSYMDSQKRILVPHFSNNNLISVYSLEGKFLQSFGKPCEVNSPYNGPYSKIYDNYIHLRMDAEDNIYIVFYNQPIIRKYNSKFDLVYEVNFNKLAAIKQKLKDNKIAWKNVKGKRGWYIYNSYFQTVCLDDSNLYVHVQAGDFPVLELDKNTGKIIKEYFLLKKDNKNYVIDNIACNKNYFFTSSGGNLIITKK